ncbi:hypothetical protein NECAME_15328 [Necator americanus]|uniref:SCP domain-containing protein n=1 Tax=Necator americanus TaxID=51031 RepID=W2SL18_NECAM|nr:hypothetical protein NECAME_15328 [Necator americanus]ETN69432.1 hypothetical protein NECAME_15328 [Necator americanus]
MELEAFSFAKYQQTPKEGRGIISFEGDYPGDLMMVLDTFLRNQTAVQQMIYPFATRYGCWMRLLNKVKPYQAKFYCVYDRKPMACEKDSDCIYQPAECRKSLCYLKSK